LWIYTCTFSLLKKKKKKDTKELFFKKQTLQFIDSIFHWQDSKVRGDCLFKRNYTLFYLFPGKEFSLFFKLLVLLSFIGGFSKNVFVNSTQAGNFCLFGDLDSGRISVLKEIKKFWRNSFFLSLDSLDSTGFLNYQIEPFLGKRIKFGLISRFLSEVGVFFLDNIGNLETDKKNFINKRIESIFKIFLGEDDFNPTFPRPVLFASAEVKENPETPGKKVIVSPLVFRSQFFFREINRIRFKKFFDILFFLPMNKKLGKNKKKYTSPTLFIRKYPKIKTTIPSLSLKNGFRKWSHCNFKKYFIFSKSFLRPKFSQEAETFLLVWYKKESFKKTFEGKEISFLEKLIRLSEAHARLLLQDFVLVSDCVLALFIVYYSFISDEFFRPSNIYFDLLEMNLNIFPSFRRFHTFAFIKRFKAFGGIKGLAGGTLKI